MYNGLIVSNVYNRIPARKHIISGGEVLFGKWSQEWNIYKNTTVKELVQKLCFISITILAPFSLPAKYRSFIPCKNESKLLNYHLIENTFKYINRLSRLTHFRTKRLSFSLKTFLCSRIRKITLENFTKILSFVDEQ